MSEKLNFTSIKRLSTQAVGVEPSQAPVDKAAPAATTPEVLDEVTVSPVRVPATNDEVEDNYNPVLDEDDDETYAAPEDAEEVEATPCSKREAKESSKVATLGRSEVSKSYRRSRITETDKEVIEFLYEFGYATVTQLRALFEGKQYGSTRGQGKRWVPTGKPLTSDPMLKRLKGLEALGFIERRRFPIGKALWFCTDLGQSIIGRSSGPEPKRASNIVWSRVEHSLMRNQVAAMLIGYEKFGGASLNIFGASKPSGLAYEFISESFMERSYNKVTKKEHSVVAKAELQEALKAKFLKELQGQSSADGYSSVEDRYASLWTASVVLDEKDKSGKTRTYPDGNPVRKAVSARPDLVFKLPRLTAAQGNSIAIELERENKDIADYVNRFKAYANWKGVYCAVVYVLVDKDPHRRGMRGHSGLDQRTKILRAIDIAGCKGFVRVVSLRDTDGNPFYDSQSIWEI